MLTIPQIYEILKLLPYTIYLGVSHKNIAIHTIDTSEATNNNSYLGSISLVEDKSKQVILFTPWFVSPKYTHSSYNEEVFHNYLCLELIEHIERLFDIVLIPNSNNAYVIRGIKDNTDINI